MKSLSNKIREVKNYMENTFEPDEYMKIQLGVSGGKDSTATYLLLMELGYDFTPTFSDTGNEHPSTVEHAMTLAERTGGPEVVLCERNYTEAEFAARRKTLREKWSQPHRIQMGPRRGEFLPPVPEHLIQEALEQLHPTGERFLDMMLLHGMNPTRKQQFCTIELKLEPLYFDVLRPWTDAGYDILSCSGVRADESKKRSEMPRWHYDQRFCERPDDVIVFHPILHWTAEDCFAMHKRHSVEPNPLYSKGMGRVGCLPCIHATQTELVEIHKRFPEELERIHRWELAVAKVSRWAVEHGAEIVSFIGPRGFGGGSRDMFKGTLEYVRWVGDKPTVDLNEAPPACASLYGLCE